MKGPLIIYHGSCYDGFTAAWVARKVYGDEADYQPAIYGQPLTETRNRTVYMLDFSYPRPVMVEMALGADSALCLDHHATAKEALEGLNWCVFDMNRSGARMAWDWFFPNEEVPWLLLYIEDRDLWRGRYGRATECAHAYMASIPMTFEHWDRAFAMKVTDLLDLGSAVLSYQEVWREKACKEAIRGTLDGVVAVFLNVPYQNFSETAHELLLQHHEAQVAVGWFQRKDGKFLFSLRSREDGPDVSQIAKARGGGGHPHASGFEITGLQEATVFLAICQR